jgi:XTP/dITP diphosphohydrolase
VALVLSATETHTFAGTVAGRITEQLQGTEGFGYDPVFQPTEAADHRTFAQMTLAEKNAISHRGRAVAGLVAFLNATSGE